MNCPLHIPEVYQYGEETQLIYAECMEHECAWWHAEEGCCAVLNLSVRLVHLHRAILQNTAMEGKK